MHETAIRRAAGTTPAACPTQTAGIISNLAGIFYFNTNLTGTVR